MSKAKLFVFGWMCIIFAGCSSPADTPPTAVVSTPVAAVPTPQSDGGSDIISADEPSDENNSLPTATAIIMNTVVPASTPTTVATPLPSESNEPVIREMRFFDNNNPTPADQFVSPNEVFVQFEYANIPDGALLKRDWYFNNSLFITREEAWNGAAFGQNGMRNDISIFDYESGLAAGVYQLNLFIDGVEQTNRTFVIEASNSQSNREPVVDAKFVGISFKGIGPYSMEVGDRLERPTEMFAEWSYADMVAGDMVRRDWYFNDELLISREEAWDFDKYGESGWVDDISIYDYETGLLAGNYRLELYVNEQFQIEQSVEIVEHYQLPPLVEPISGKQLLSDNLNTVTVINPDGSTMTQAVAGRIQSADWFPGGERVVFAATTLVDLDAPFPSLAHASELWLWDLPSDQLTQFGTTDERYHSPRVSPDGLKVATLSGTGYGDAGYVDSVVVVFQFDEAGLLVGSATTTDLTLAEFSLVENFPWTVHQDETYQANLVTVSTSWIVSPGIWLTDSTLRTNLGFGGALFDQDGVFDLNFDTLIATRVE